MGISCGSFSCDMQSHAVIFFQKNNLKNTESYAIVIDFTENIKYKTASNSVRIKFRSHEIPFA